MSELWKPVVGWEQWYEVSNHGRIRSIPRRTVSGHGWRDIGGIVSPILCGNGYLAVNLTGGGKRKQLMVHRMVLCAFVGGPPIGMEACHNNGVRIDCRLDNLRWDTRKNNHADKRVHGTAQVGSRANNAKLNEQKARIIRYSVLPMRQLSNMFGVSVSTIGKVKYRASWKHV